MFRYGLRSQLAFNLGVVMFLASMGLSFLALYVEQVRDIRMRRRHIQEVARFLESGWRTHQAPSLSDQNRLRWMHRWMVTLERFRPEAALCLDERGKLLWQLGRFSAKEKVSQLTQMNRVYQSRWITRVEPDRRGEVWERVIPLRHERGQIGLMWVRWRIAVDRQEFFAYQTLLLFYLFLFCLVLLLLILLFLTRRFVKPLERLGQAMERLAQKGRSDGLDREVTRQDELGDLARSFLEMETILQAHQAAREAQLHALREANETLQRAQDELIQREKLSSIGQMAAGVAHEVGNPLSAIIGYSDLLKTSDTWGEMEKDLAVRIEKEAKRIDRIIRELLDYARPKHAKSAACLPQQAILETIELLRLQPRFRQMKLHQDIQDGLPNLHIEESSLMQVLINLLLNAADACKGKGEIWLSAYQESQEQTSQPWVIISIEDDGPGISADLQKKIFEPFFTTKDPGKGVGLGLAICQRTILEAGGSLRIEKGTRSPTGAIFLIRLPS